MNCPHCGKSNPDNCLYCEECGTRLPANVQPQATSTVSAATCPTCHAAVKPGAAFCGKCGSKLIVPSYTPPPPVVSDNNGAVRAIPFGEAVGNFFANYANFNGRATRSEYWFVVLFSYIVGFALALTSYIDVYLYIVLLSFYSIAVMIPTLSLFWRRLHDIGKSGGYFFMTLIPIAGPFIVLAYFLMESGPDNIYGKKKTVAEYNKLK